MTRPGIGATRSTAPPSWPGPRRRAARSTSGGGATRNGDAAPGDVEVDDVADADRGDRRVGLGPTLCRVVPSVDGRASRRRVEPPAAGPRRAVPARRAVPRPRDQAASGRAVALGPPVRRPDAVERVGACLAVPDDRLAHEPAQEPQVRRHAEHDRGIERRGQPVQRRRPVRAVGDDLGQHRVEAARDLVPVRDAGVDPDAVAARPAEVLEPSGRRQEPVLGILGVQPDLDGVADDGDVGLVEPERLAGRDAQLVGDEVPPGDELGDGMLDLEPRVHLEERDGAALVDEELAGPGPDVADRAAPARPPSSPSRTP